MKKIRVHTPFELTLPDYTKRHFVAGLQLVEDDIAEHWFVKRYSEPAEGESLPASDGESALIIERLQGELAELTGQVAEMQGQIQAAAEGLQERNTAIAEKDQQLAELTGQVAELSAKLEKGNGAKK